MRLSAFILSLFTVFAISSAAAAPDDVMLAPLSGDACYSECDLEAAAIAGSTNVDNTQPAVTESPAASTSIWSANRFALKTNLLDYAVLMPNVEAEWKFASKWSAALEYQIAWWSKCSPRKVYRLASIIPEARYWVIDRDRWHGMYVGAFAGIGEYDLSNSRKGHKGEFAMGGFSVGYMWPIGKHLSLDAGLGLGYMRARDKYYKPSDGHNLYQHTKNINYFGPLRVKLSLVWRIQSEQ